MTPVARLSSVDPLQRSRFFLHRYESFYFYVDPHVRLRAGFSVKISRLNIGICLGSVWGGDTFIARTPFCLWAFSGNAHPPYRTVLDFWAFPFVCQPISDIFLLYESPLLPLLIQTNSISAESPLLCYLRLARRMFFSRPLFLHS